jgi:hypothetical protein
MSGAIGCAKKAVKLAAFPAQLGKNAIWHKKC